MPEEQKKSDTQPENQTVMPKPQEGASRWLKPVPSLPEHVNSLVDLVRFLAQLQGGSVADVARHLNIGRSTLNNRVREPHRWGEGLLGEIGEALGYDIVPVVDSKTYMVKGQKPKPKPEPEPEPKPEPKPEPTQNTDQNDYIMLPMKRSDHERFKTIMRFQVEKKGISADLSDHQKNAKLMGYLVTFAIDPQPGVRLCDPKYFKKKEK